MKKNDISVLMSLGLVLMSARCVFAAPPGTSLQGTYALTGSSVCVQTSYGLAGDPAPYGFVSGDNTFTLLRPANDRTRHVSGVLVLNRNGTGTIHQRVMQILHQYLSLGQRPINVWEGNCSVSHSSLGDGTYEMSFNGCTGTNLAGAGYPGTAGVESVSLSVAASSAGDILLLSGGEPRIETVWNADPDSTPNEAERVCTRSLTAVRIR